MNQYEVADLIGSIKNRCIIVETLFVIANLPEGVIATLLEDIYEDAQELVLDHCDKHQGNLEETETSTGGKHNISY